LTKTKLNLHQIETWAGILGPVFFVMVFTVEGWLRGGYDPARMFVSELSLGPRGWIQIMNFVIFGTLLLLFTRRVAAQFHVGKAARFGPILLRIVGICFFVSGPFVMDPAGTPPDQMSWRGLLHGIFGGIVFSLMPVICFVFLRRFREDPKWRSLQGWTLVAGTIIAAAVLLLTVATKFPATQHIFINWVGLIQRTAIVPFMAWLFTFALKLHLQK
jgi:hypothetical protein